MIDFKGNQFEKKISMWSEGDIGDVAEGNLGYEVLIRASPPVFNTTALAGARVRPNRKGKTQKLADNKK